MSGVRARAPGLGRTLEYHRRLIELHHTNPVVTTGDFELLVSDHPARLGVSATRGPSCRVAGRNEPPGSEVELALSLDEDC